MVFNLFQRLSIRSKMILMLLLVGACSTVVVGYVGYENGQRSLQRRIHEQLKSVRGSKVDQLESYFRYMKHQIQSLSENLMTVEAMESFRKAYDALAERKDDPKEKKALWRFYQRFYLPHLAKVGTSIPRLERHWPVTPAARHLQSLYIASNPHPVGQKDKMLRAAGNDEYHKVHKKFHALFRNFIKRFRYDDIFLVDGRSRQIVYSVKKEVDFATNLRLGPYSSSNLARVVELALQAGEHDAVRLVDFSSYHPSYLKPAAFLASPIFRGTLCVGVLVFQIPISEIDEVMTGHKHWQVEGLGKTGETYIVGVDRLMRSDSRFLLENPKTYFKSLKRNGVSAARIKRIKNANSSVLQQEVRTPSVRAAFAGKTGLKRIHGYRGRPVLSAYAPVHIAGLKWSVISEIDVTEAFKPIENLQLVLLRWAVVLIVLITLLAMLFATLFVRPLSSLTHAVEQVREGESVPALPTTSRDEFAMLSRKFNEMVVEIDLRYDAVEEQVKGHQELLTRFMPEPIVLRLQQQEHPIVDSYPNVSVLFADLTGFTEIAEKMTAEEALQHLDALFREFDEASKQFGVEKVKTIGDVYMAVCGMPAPRLDHAKRLIDFGIELVRIVRRFNKEHQFSLGLSIGMDTGSVIAGIVGLYSLRYDLWGETVNAARELIDPETFLSFRMTQAVYERVEDVYEFLPDEAWTGRDGQAVETWTIVL